MARPEAKRPSPERILVVQTAFLGDIVLTTSFLANLRQLAPNAEIRLLTTPAGAAVLDPNPFGLRTIRYDKRGRDRGAGGFLRLARELRAFAPDLVFCVHRSLRSALLAKVSGGEIYGFHEAAGSVLFPHRVPRRLGAFEAEKNHELLRAWAGERAASLPLFPRLATSAADEAAADALLAGAERFVALAPSSVWATKRWPGERFGVLAAELWRLRGLRPVFVGGGEPADLAASAAALAAFRERAGPAAAAPLDLSGKTSLGSLKSVLSRAQLVVANDSAPLHVAVAMGTKALGVFGPTTRDLGFFPLAPAGRSAVAEVSGLDCRPCGAHGHAKCPRGHFRCMLDLGVPAVLEKALTLVEECR